MTRVVEPAARLLLGCLVATLALAGCGAGGFGSTQPATPDRAIDHYVAMGDGFTAAPYVGRTASDDGCLRSRRNYPALLARKLHIDHVTDVSCTGAQTRAVRTRSRPVDGDPVKPQIAAVDRETDLITLGIGIEDRDLLHDLFDLCLAYPCGSMAPAPAVLDNVDRFGASLTATVRTLQARAPNAEIVLVGYPQLTPPRGTCADLAGLTGSQLEGANLVLQRINGQIRSAAFQTGSGFIDVARISAHHALCSRHPWVSGRSSSEGQAVALHPLAAEQRAVADAIAAYLGGH